MSNLEINEAKKTGYLRGVTLMYTKIQQATNKYQSQEKEWTVDAVVDKATAKAWKKQFPKQNYKEIETAEFESKFKTAPPFPDADEQFVIKLKQDEVVNGKTLDFTSFMRPKVLVPVEGGVKDVTATTLVGNGSVGDVSFGILSNTYGTFAKLRAVLVQELVEYEAAGGSGFGTVVATDGAPEPVQASQSDSSTAPSDDTPEPVKAPEEASEDSDGDDDDIPF